MPVLPIKHRRGYYTDNDEAPRRRARGIAQLTKAYEQSGYYNDMGTGGQADPSKDYDMFSRVRPSGQAMKSIISGYSEKIRKKGKR